MKLVFEKSYFIFWIAIPIIMVIGYFNSKKTIDINVHDTYYVAAIYTLAIILSIYFGLIGLIYYLAKVFNFNTYSILINIHILISLLVFPFIYLTTFFYKSNSNLDIISIINNQKFNDKITYIIIILFCIFLMTQILFLINIIIGFIRK